MDYRLDPELSGVQIINVSGKIILQKMIDYTITKNDARKIFVSRLILIVPCVFVGIFIGFYQCIGQIYFEIILPVTIGLMGFAIFIGMQIGIKKLTGLNLKLENNFITQTKTNNAVASFSLDEIISTKENFYGLILKSKGDQIIIHKQLSIYEDLKTEICRGEKLSN